MSQRFRASDKDTFTWSNGAIGYPPAGLWDCLGPFAKVKNCPISDTQYRLTCYASGYPDTFFSIPASTRIHGKYVTGFFATDQDGGLHFYPNQNQ